jgi:hypothetical protein
MLLIIKQMENKEFALNVTGISSLIIILIIIITALIS